MEGDLRVLAAVATTRMDNGDRRMDSIERDAESRLHDQRRLEAKVAELSHALALIQGASGGWKNAAPWVAMAISAAFAIWGRL